MAVLTIAEAKVELRSDAADDARVQSLLEAAIQSASDYINRSIPWTDAAGAEVPVPATVNAAIRLELKALYDRPESIQCAAFKSLLNPYRTGMGI